MAEIKSIKAYETSKNGLATKAANLVVTTADYTHVIRVEDTEAAAKEKIDVAKIVGRRETILKKNQKYIDSVVNGKPGKKEIDYSNLVTVAATEPVKEGGK